MDIKPLLVNIIYTNEIEDIIKEKFFTKKVKKVIKFEGSSNKNISLDIDKGIKLVTHEKSRLGKGLEELAISIDKKNVAEFECKIFIGNKYITNLKYLEKENIFFKETIFERNQYNNNLEVAKEYINANIAAGTYNLHILRNKVLFKIIKVNVYPSGLNYDDYLKMIDEIRDFQESLISNNTSSIGIFKQEIERFRFVDSKLRVFEKYLTLIDKSPRHKLSTSIEMINKKNIKRYDSKFIREHAKNQFKLFSRQEIPKATYDIYEHQIIYKYLEKLYEKVERFETRLNLKYKDELLKLDVFKEKYQLNNRVSITENHKAFLKKIKLREEKVAENNKEIELDYKNNYLIGVNFDVEKSINNINKNINYDFRITSKGLFEINISSVYINKDWSIFLSKKLGNPNKILYSDRLYDDEKYTLKNTNTLDSKKFVCKFETSNLNEVIFLYYSLKNMKSGRLNIDGIAKKTGDKDYLFKYTPCSHYKEFAIELFKVNSINGKKPELYSKEQITYFICECLKTGQNAEAFERFSFMNSLLVKEKKLNDLDFSKILEIKKRIENLKSKKIFKDVKNIDNQRLRSTQIFISDIYYRQIFKELKSLDDDFNVSFDKSNEYILVNSTQNIYEIWCLFKILSTLVNEMNFEVGNKNELKKVVDNFIRNNTTLSGLIVNLRYKISAKEYFDVDVKYEHKIVYNNARYKLPDYQLIIRKYNTEKNEIITKKIYLDAKYRNYDKQGIGNKLFANDIKKVAIEKYFNTFVNTDNEPVVSAIIHSDKKEKYVDFGYNNEMFNCNKSLEGHNYSGIYLVPSDNKKLKILLKMIFEYHFKVYEVCFECGERKNIKKEILYTKSDYEKFHFTCNNCGEFWVKTHCNEKGKNHDLFKHIQNYHYEREGDTWYVSCPKCNG